MFEVIANLMIAKIFREVLLHCIIALYAMRLEYLLHLKFNIKKNVIITAFFAANFNENFDRCI